MFLGRFGAEPPMFSTRSDQRPGTASDATDLAPGKRTLTGGLTRSHSKRVREDSPPPATAATTETEGHDEVATDPLAELRDADPVLGLDRSRGPETAKRSHDGTDRHTPLGRDKRARNPSTLAALLQVRGRAMSLPLLDEHATQLEDPSLAHLRPEAAPLLAEARAVATKPAVKRQRTLEVEPSTARAAEPEYDDFEAAWLADALTRLDAIFTLHVEDNAAVVPSAKAASVARHATIGEQAVLALLAPPGEDESPLEALRSRQRIAADLEAELSAQLEQPVTLKVHLPPAEEVAEQSTIVLEIVIAPNDWWTVLVITAAATAAAATGAILWRWWVRRGATGDTPNGDGRAPRDARTAPPTSTSDRPSAPRRDADAPDAAPEPPLPIQGLPRPVGRNDCFVNSVLQLLAAAYPEVLTADANIDVDVRGYLRRFVSDPINPAHVAPIRAALLGAAPNFGQLVDVTVPIAQADQRGAALAELQRIVASIGVHRDVGQRLRAILGQVGQPGQPFGADVIRTFRARLLDHRPRLVESANAQEDAQELLGKILDEYAVGQRFGVHETLTITGSVAQHTVPANLHPAQPPMQYDGANQHAHDAEPENTLKVPIDGRFAGLIDYLHVAFGAGTDEVFAPGAEWARRHDGSTVAVTRRQVAKTFTHLPDLMTVMLVRHVPGHAKRTDAFRMPTTLRLVEHDPHAGDRVVCYELRAFIHHSGERANGGHYWAHIKSDEGWLQADDAQVRRDRQSAHAQPREHDLTHDLDHGYLYTYVVSEVQDGQVPADGIASGEYLDPATLPAALPQLGHGGRGPARSTSLGQRPAATSDKAEASTAGPKGKDAAPVAAALPKTIVQCGNMTGDQFIIAAALRLDPSLRVRVIWDRVYYPAMYREEAAKLGTTVVELFNRNLSPDKHKAEGEIDKILAERMSVNATRIGQFYESVGIDPSRILIEETDTETFSKGAYQEEFAHVKAAVHPKDGSTPDPSLAVPGYATSVVSSEFARDRVHGQDVVAGMFDRLDDKTRAAVDEFRKGKVGDGKIILLWSRGSSRNPGGGNPGLDSDPNVLEQLVELVRTQFPGWTPWVIGDPVPDASPTLAAWIKDHSLVEYWNQIGGLSLLGQMYFLDQLHRRNQGMAVGMISGVLELPALLGMPTFYFELSTMREKGKRWQKMAGDHGGPESGAIPNLKQHELSIDQEYSANLRGVFNQLRGWLDAQGQGTRASPQVTREAIAAVLACGAPTSDHTPAHFDPDVDDSQARQRGLAAIATASQTLAAAKAHGLPAELALEDRRQIGAAMDAARARFAMDKNQLGDFAALIAVWMRIEEVGRERAAFVAKLDDAAVIEQLRRMAPQAEIEDHGASVTINGTLSLAVGDVRERMARDPPWLSKHLKVERPRAILAAEPLRLESSEATVAEAQGWTKDADAQAAIERLAKLLGLQAFTGLVADLRLTPQSLPDLVPHLDFAKLAAVRALVGVDVLAGVLVEFRASPGRLTVFVDGLLAKRERLAPPQVAPGGLDEAVVLHSRLALPMHRAVVAQEDPKARELTLRERTPFEISQVQGVEQVIDDPTRPVVTSALGHGQGGGRDLQVDLGFNDAPAIGQGVLPITAEDRTSDAYQQMLAAVYALQVRGVGRAQLAELAEVFLAAKKTKSRPRFVTAHPGIIDALGVCAGYPMATRNPKEPYRHFFAEENLLRGLGAAIEEDPEAVPEVVTDRATFDCTVDGATIVVEPIDTVRFSKPPTSTHVARLAATRDRGARFDNGTQVDCQLLPSAFGVDLGPERVVGRVRGYTVEGDLRVEDDQHKVHEISMQAYHVEITGRAPAAQFAAYTVEEVQAMFPDVKDIAGKLRGLLTRTVAKEVTDIEHHTVADYVQVLTDAGFDAFIVGGAVRDVISGKKDPADIDIATTMPAIDAMSGFESRRLADRQGADQMPKARVLPAHGIAQVEHQVETGLDVVSLHSAEHGVQAMDLGTDAGNRDFTFNALFFDPQSQRVVDPTGCGLTDLKGNILRWTCDTPARDEAAIRAKLRGDSYQVGRWLKFKIKGMIPAHDDDATIVAEEFAAHLAAGLTPEEKARILDGIGRPLAEVVAKAGQLGIDAAQLRQLSPLG